MTGLVFRSRPGAAHACAAAAVVVGTLVSTGAQGPARPFSLPNVPRERPPAAGMLLVASRELADPNFAETVVVLTEYGPTGAVGLVVNRRTDVTLARVFPSVALRPEPPQAVFQGGPVDVATAQALRRGRGHPGRGRSLADGLQVIGTPDALHAQLADTTHPDIVRVYVGYAGWSSGQLDVEVRVGAWHVFPPDAGVVFDSDPDTLWARQIRRTEWRSARSTVHGTIHRLAAP